MAWFCSLCYRSRSFVLAAKFATMEGVQLGDICWTCLKEKAEQEISMNKLDRIGIGYTADVLKYNALPLFRCEGCGNMVPEIVITKPSNICASCVLTLAYVDANDMMHKVR